MKESLTYLLGRVEGQLGVLKVRLDSDTPGQRKLVQTKEYRLVVVMFDEVFQLLAEIIRRIDDGTRLGDPGTDTYDPNSND
jgi:hypothetical protein